MIFKKPSLLYAAMILSTSMTAMHPVYAVNDESLENFGDIAQFALPVIGLGAT